MSNVLSLAIVTIDLILLLFKCFHTNIKKWDNFMYASNLPVSYMDQEGLVTCRGGLVFVSPLSNTRC